MSHKWMSNARAGAVAVLLLAAALAAQAHVSLSFGVNLGWPAYPVYPAYPPYATYPPTGTVAAVLPGSAVTVRFGGTNYWHHGGVWYQPWGTRWVVVVPPVGIAVPMSDAPADARPASSVASMSKRPEPVAVPRNGQDAQQAEADRRECDRWATTQPQALADATAFMRAVDACMDARGYTMK